MKQTILQSDDEIHFNTGKSSVWKITSLLDSLYLAAKAVLSAFFQVGYLQEQQIQASRLRFSYQTLMHLNSNSVGELKR